MTFSKSVYLSSLALLVACSSSKKTAAPPANPVVASQSMNDTARKTKAPVTLFLVNGVKLQGIVTWFDNFSVLLRRDNHSQLVYKHAISTVMPINPIQLFEGEETTDQQET
mgnify:CR=1 FL=1